MRVVLVSALVSSLSLAPVQCARTPDPTLRVEDSPGDALWDLAQDFRAKKDEAAARSTLKFLVDKYPSSRHAAAARAELDGQADGG